MIKKLQELRLPSIAIKAVPLLLWILILFGSYERLIAAFQISPLQYPFSDPGRHWSYAMAAFTENPLTVFDNIGYQVWLAAISRITGSDVLALGIYTALLSIFTPWIWYRFFRELFESKDLALLGWVLIAWLPSWIGIYDYFMTETIFLPGLGLALWFTWRSARRRTLESFVWASIFWFVAIAIRPIAVPPAIFCLAWLLLAHHQQKQKIFMLCLIALCFFLPLAYRNYRVLGIFSPLPYKVFDVIHMISGQRDVTLALRNKNGTISRYLFMSASCNLEPFFPLSHWKSSRSNSAVAVAVDLNNGTTDWVLELRRHWCGFPMFFKMWVENIIFLLFGPSWPDSNPEHFWESLAFQMRWLWAPLLVFVTVNDIIYFQKHKKVAVLPLLVLFTWAICLVLPCVPVEGRYRKPLEGLLVTNLLWLIAKRKSADSNQAQVDLNSGC